MSTPTPAPTASATTKAEVIENFLAPSKHASAILNEVSQDQPKKTLDVVTLGFEDKIVVLIHSNGRISKMYNVPLLASPVPSHILSLPGSGLGSYHGDDDDNYDDQGGMDEFLPLPHLTPMPLIGGSQEDDIQGRIYATQIASMIARQAPEDRRIVVVGLGPDIGPRPGQDVELSHRKEFLQVIKLAQECRVW